MKKRSGIEFSIKNKREKFKTRIKEEFVKAKMRGINNMRESC